MGQTRKAPKGKGKGKKCNTCGGGKKHGKHNQGKRKTVKKVYRPKIKKTKGGALLFPSVNAVTNGISSSFTGLYNTVQGNTPVHSSNPFDQPLHKKI